MTNVHHKQHGKHDKQYQQKAKHELKQFKHDGGRGDYTTVINEINQEYNKYCKDGMNCLDIFRLNSLKKAKRMRCNMCAQYPQIADKGMLKSNKACAMALKEGLYTFDFMNYNLFGNAFFITIIYNDMLNLFTVV